LGIYLLESNIDRWKWHPTSTFHLSSINYDKNILKSIFYFYSKVISKMKYIFSIVSILLSTFSFAQVGIGTNTPNSSAALDLNSSNKGFLLPRVNLTSTTDATTIISPASGLLVYNTNTSIGEGVYVNMGTPSSPNWSSITIFNSSKGINVGKVVYSAASGDNSKVVSVKNFSFRIGGGTGWNQIQMKMNANPGSSKTININNVEGWGNNGYQHSYNPVTYTTSNWSTFQTIGNGADINAGSYSVMYFGYAPTNSFYRITIAMQGSSPFTYSLIVEEF
jgi:hypothetical protein